VARIETQTLPQRVEFDSRVFFFVYEHRCLNVCKPVRGAPRRAGHNELNARTVFDTPTLRFTLNQMVGSVGVRVVVTPSGDLPPGVDPEQTKLSYRVGPASDFGKFRDRVFSRFNLHPRDRYDIF